ncbi:MAG TPA: hypothetical protein VJO34_12795 [Methylomirabilota bacterium]|nr:hypothetical protein [Methylomirabilota bacterium]
MIKLFLAVFFYLFAVVVTIDAAFAHGVVGKRFFPATLATEDPFVADELALPTVLHIKRPAEHDLPPHKETEISAELQKRITPSFSLSVGGEFVHLEPDGLNSENGFGNLELGAKYGLFKSEPHEAIVSLGVELEVGGTGNKSVHAESFSEVSPAIFFGKGLGDLPESAKFLRPVAVTGTVGAKIPTRSKTVTVHVHEDGDIEREVERHSNSLKWGFAIEYSIPYLLSFVQDIGLPSVLRRIIPLVELDLETFLDRGRGGQTNGTVNPGFIWAGKSIELGVEAVIPINDRTGQNVGVRGLIHFFLDDLFPMSIGRPIFGR